MIQMYVKIAIKENLIPVENEGVVICDKCHVSLKYIVEHDKPSYKEPPKEVCFYAYKRINHFREILGSISSKRINTNSRRSY